MANGSNVICQRSTMNGARLKETEWKRWSKRTKDGRIEDDWFISNFQARTHQIFVIFERQIRTIIKWTTTEQKLKWKESEREREREREWLNGSSNKKNEIVMCKEVRVDVAHSGNSSSVYFRLRHSTTDYSVLLGLFSIFLAHHFPFIHMKSRHINWQRAGIIHW